MVNCFDWVLAESTQTLVDWRVPWGISFDFQTSLSIYALSANGRLSMHAGILTDSGCHWQRVIARDKYVSADVTYCALDNPSREKKDKTASSVIEVRMKNACAALCGGSFLLQRSTISARPQDLSFLLAT